MSDKKRKEELKEKYEAILIHETEIKSPKSKYFGLEAQSRN
jgi:hypothetical protein